MKFVAHAEERKEVPDELEPDLQNSCIQLPEISRNQLLFSQISEMAHEKGYFVATNKSVIDVVTACVSTHSKSET